MSNSTEPAPGQTRKPTTSVSTPTAPGTSVDDPVAHVMLVSGIGVALAVVGLVVTLLVAPGSEESESDAAPPATTTKSSTSTPAPAPAAPATSAGTSEQYLAELAPVDGTPSTGTVTVDGVSYPHAVYQQFSGCSTEASHTYDLDGEWSRFSSVIGVADGGDTDSTLQFSVIADGKSVFTSGNIGVGVPPELDVPVAGVENLTIGFTLLNAESSSCSSRSGSGVWGDPVLTK